MKGGIYKMKKNTFYVERFVISFDPPKRYK